MSRADYLMTGGAVTLGALMLAELATWLVARRHFVFGWPESVLGRVVRDPLADRPAGMAAGPTVRRALGLARRLGWLILFLILVGWLVRTGEQWFAFYHTPWTANWLIDHEKQLLDQTPAADVYLHQGIRWASFAPPYLSRAVPLTLTLLAAGALLGLWLFWPFGRPRAAWRRELRAGLTPHQRRGLRRVYGTSLLLLALALLGGLGFLSGFTDFFLDYRWLFAGNVRDVPQYLSQFWRRFYSIGIFTFTVANELLAVIFSAAWCGGLVALLAALQRGRIPRLAGLLQATVRAFPLLAASFLVLELPDLLSFCASAVEYSLQSSGPATAYLLFCIGWGIHRLSLLVRGLAHLFIFFPFLAVLDGSGLRRSARDALRLLLGRRAAGLKLLALCFGLLVLGHAAGVGLHRALFAAPGELLDRSAWLLAVAETAYALPTALSAFGAVLLILAFLNPVAAPVGPLVPEEAPPLAEEPPAEADAPPREGAGKVALLAGAALLTVLLTVGAAGLVCRSLTGLRRAVELGLVLAVGLAALGLLLANLVGLLQRWWWSRWTCPLCGRSYRLDAGQPVEKWEGERIELPGDPVGSRVERGVTLLCESCRAKTRFRLDGEAVPGAPPPDENGPAPERLENSTDGKDSKDQKDGKDVGTER